MTKNTDRIAALEAEVEKLRQQVAQLFSERQNALEAQARDLRRSIGLRP